MGGAVETSTPSSDPFDHELRFLLSRSEMRLFLDAVALRAAIEIYDPQRPISFTRTTYFDTDDLNYFRSGDGSPARRLRVREYAVAASLDEAPVLSGVAFIELKQHEGDVRRKERLAGTPAEIARLVESAGATPPGLASGAPFPAIARELALPTMAPRLGTWYRRLCLTAEARHVRITLDENLTFCRPQPIGEAGALASPHARELVAAFPARVLEVKLTGPMPFWLGKAIESLERADGFSKFRMGMTALGHDTDVSEAEARDAETADAEQGLRPFGLGSFVAA